MRIYDQPSVSDRPTRGSVGRVTNFGEQKRIGAQLVPRSVPSTHSRIVRRGWHATVGTRHRCSRYWSDPESNGRRNEIRRRTLEGPAHSLLRALPTVELMSSCTEVKIARKEKRRGWGWEEGTVRDGIRTRSALLSRQRLGTGSWTRNEERRGGWGITRSRGD